MMRRGCYGLRVKVLRVGLLHGLQGEDKPSPLLWLRSCVPSPLVHSRGDGLSSPCSATCSAHKLELLLYASRQGRRQVKVLPWPKVLSTLTWPPCNSTII